MARRWAWLGVLAGGVVLFEIVRRVAKLIVPVVVLLLARRRLSPADGLLVGVAPGAGSAACGQRIGLVGTRR
jgi:protease PrsW